MKFQHIPNKGFEWDTNFVPQCQIYPKQRTNSGKVCALEIPHTPSFFKVIKLKYGNRKIKSENDPGLH
jgi:hypothetical protein